MSALPFRADSSDQPVASSASTHLYGPVIDFLLLGGGSLIALLLLRLGLGGGTDAMTTSFTVTLAMAHVINHPHFAHSYQIFYSDYRAKLFSSNYSKNLRLRYFLAGIVAPLLIAGFLWWCVAGGHARALGLAANAMFFLVGWHYVKQGYGMAMVDAGLKRAFYSAGERRAMLANGYAVWILSWLLVNYLIGRAPKTYFGIEYFVIQVAAPALWLATSASIVTTVWLLALLRKRSLARKPLAWNGLLAYGVSLYAWLLVRDPIVLLWIPMFHSLQYLAVVWRFQSNRIKNTTPAVGAAIGRRMRLILFAFTGLVAGYVGFWALPYWLGSNVPYDELIFGPELFFFVSWIFINIHHYLLDTVMWRKGNPDVAQHLFGIKQT